MKIILSRKGFDSENGEVASPIFRKEDGALGMYSIPAPLDHSTCGYDELQWSKGSLGELVRSLRGAKGELSNGPHLDPDLVRGALKERHPDWRPIFGQSGGQESQLRNDGVGAQIGMDEEDFTNDGGGRPLFLFFGWYRMVALRERGYQFLRKEPNIHALFGWLQVARKVNFAGKEDREAFQHNNPWAAKHPHVACSDYDKQPNAIYIAPKPGSEDDRLILDLQDTGLPASGMFSTFDPGIHALTRQGQTRRNWQLPFWFYRDGQPKLGMHVNGKIERWKKLDGQPQHIGLQSVDKGQEFVFDSKDYDTELVRNWVTGIVQAGQGRL